ncbi:MAG: PDZ domain-containing protein [Myxococcales bacterium]|nr:PDZ domain-containing protein [Myxococcales bacterium]MCB9750057.1 PDZ domain-containing protein [Myxococcales bacterium]
MTAALLLALPSCSSCARQDAPTEVEDSKQAPEQTPLRGLVTPEEEAALDEALSLNTRPFPLLAWTAYRVEREYFAAERFAPRDQLLAALTGLGLHRPEFFAKELPGDRVEVTVGSDAREFSLAGLDGVQAAAARLEEILVFTKDSLGSELRDDDERELEYAAINGLLAPLDPHTILLDPKEHSDLGVKTRGQFGGVGLEIVADARRIRVVGVLPGGPAEKAGLKPGDLLLAIDGQSTVNMKAPDAQQMLRGPVDTEVTVKLQRGDNEVLTITITRAIIKVESVTGERMPDGIGYLKISTFQQNTGEQARAAIEKLLGPAESQAKGAGAALRGLVIDMRGNSGGLLAQAIEVLDLLVPAGELVIVRSAEGRESESAQPEVIVPAEVSVVALIDESSASASEIVAGSLKHTGRGLVVGRSSFGKGTVQLLVPRVLYDQEQALKLTVAEYFVAGERPVQTTGVETDLALLPVQMTPLAGIVNFYDLERFERRRERAQVAHLPSAKHAREFDVRAATRGDRYLRYFLDPDGVAAERARASAVVEGERMGLLEDPEIRVAHAVADAVAGITGAKERDAKLKQLRARLVGEEDAAIIKGLERVGIDWRGAAGAHGDPELALTAEVVGELPVVAGTPFVLRLSLTNRGDAPAERVHLSTHCLQDELDGIELMLGRVEPGQSVTRELRLQVMSWHTSFVDTLTVEAHGGEPDEEPDATARVRFEISGLPRPHLSFDYWIVDDPTLAAGAPSRPPQRSLPGETPFAVAGNGDGALQPGERVLLAVRVRNNGPGEVGDARALLRNHSGAQALLEEGFVALGSLAPGAETRGAFGISVNERAVVDRDVDLELTVADIRARESVRHEFGLRVVGERPAFAPAPQVYKLKETGEDAVRLYNAADSSAPVVLEPGAEARLQSVGGAGRWLAFDAGPGRRWWAPSSLVEPAKGRADKRAPPRAALMVSPPIIEISALPSVVEGAEVELRGVAKHPRRVHDVVISTRPSGPAQVERKVFYRANPAREGAAAGALEFATTLTLEPGSHVIYVTARDGDDVEVTRELRVFRE